MIIVCAKYGSRDFRISVAKFEAQVSFFLNLVSHFISTVSEIFQKTGFNYWY